LEQGGNVCRTNHAKRHARDLILRDKVDFLAGFSLTPEALAVAPVATKAKKPMIIMNAATSVITTRSSHDSPENKAFLKAYVEANGAQGGTPNFVAVAAYDGMAAIAEVINRLAA
jgi:ABC-type branched-subunit amino acid transport system substrate-binding protein